MRKITLNTPWSTILKPSYSMPDSLHMKGKRAIFLGWTKDKKFIRIIYKPNATYQQYTPEFWEVDTQYMSDREEIAELMGRIHESNEPNRIEEYRREIQDIQDRMRND